MSGGEVTMWIEEQSLKDVQVKITFSMSYGEWLFVEEHLNTKKTYEINKFGDLLYQALKRLRETWKEYAE